MIGDHAQALEMVALVAQRTANDDLKRLALRIEVSQKDEMQMMREWLERRDEQLPDPHAHHQAHGRMPGMLTAEQMSRLAAARGAAFDRLFLEGMIAHHQGALTMVKELFATPGAGQEPEMFDFASDVEANSGDGDRAHGRDARGAREMMRFVRVLAASAFVAALAAPVGAQQPRLPRTRASASRPGCAMPPSRRTAWSCWRTCPSPKVSTIRSTPRVQPNPRMPEENEQTDGDKDKNKAKSKAKDKDKDKDKDKNKGKDEAENVPQRPAWGGLNFANSDLAFSGNHLFVGNFSGFNVYDISTPERPTLLTSVVCPGGQGDVSVQGHLLFMSVEQTRGRIDCGVRGVEDPVSKERFRGVRIFDISDVKTPKQVAAVQTCRGSHTHTLVTDPKDPDHVYVYGSGTSGARSAEELEGCSGKDPKEDPQTALFSIDVIKVPVARPQEAKIVARPRIFADEKTGNIAGLWLGGDHGTGTQKTAPTNQCHDITVYPAIGLAAGACSGNGILLDIADPVNPKRLDYVSDKNFAYWHSATFNNDGTKVVFTDEWGGGMRPRCQTTDQANWEQTRSSTSSIANWCSRATTSCPLRRPPPRTAWPTMARSCPCPAATCWCRRGIRAACR